MRLKLWHFWDRFAGFLLILFMLWLWGILYMAIAQALYPH